MLVSLIAMRVGARRLAAAGLLLLPAAGCTGDDLLLPDDRSPALLRAVSGDGQTAPVGTPVRHPLVVEVLDGAGRPVEGAVVVFGFVDPPTGAEIAPPVPETDASGRAAVEVTLGAPVGDQPVEARLDDPEAGLRVRFQLTAIRTTTGGPGDGGGGDDDDDDDGGGTPGEGPPDDGGGDDDGGRGGDDDDDGKGGDGEGGKDKDDDKEKGDDGDKGKDDHRGKGKGGDGDRDDDDD